MFKMKVSSYFVLHCSARKLTKINDQVILYDLFLFSGNYMISKSAKAIG